MNSKSKQITITKLQIILFKSIFAQSFYFNQEAAICEGANGTGKTTRLDAISWCLTGADIKGNKDESNFIPNNLKMNYDGKLVEVSVELSTGTKITRQISLVGGKRTTKVFINELQVPTVKEADAKILNELGLLNLSLNTPSKISIIEFLINPLNIFTYAKKDLRELIIKQIDSIYGKKIDDLLANQPDIIKKYVNKYLTEEKRKLSLLDSITALSNNINSEIKSLKKDIEKEKIIVEFLQNKSFNDLLAEENNKLVDLNKELTTKKQDLIVLDKFILDVSMFYQTCSKQLYKDLFISLIEKGMGEDVYIETMTPYLKNNTPLYNASESEKIIATIQFVNQYIKHCGYTIQLPVLVDELESVDSKSMETLLQLLKKSKRQLIGTRVR